ncbi:MAG: hypothetical protein KBF43_10620 [Dermatophilaceae bacterium]|nr:hypothetical protein [Dermatophilaceae bacterium]MBP9919028.1 hypothetical protein [Dermatophilaceae bacterium]
MTELQATNGARAAELGDRANPGSDESVDRCSLRVLAWTLTPIVATTDVVSRAVKA